jgi:hypothetical protein
MMQKLAETIRKLEDTTAIGSFKFGHTPLQVEFFQTASQQGNEKWEYWQHVLQMRALHATLCELKVSCDEALAEIQDAKRFWPPWSATRRKRRLPRLELRLSSMRRAIEEKSREAGFHMEVVDRRYGHLKHLTEDDILADEADYWVCRLGRQLGASQLGRVLGIPESEILAVLALPADQQKKVFEGMRLFLGAAAPMLPQKQ